MVIDYYNFPDKILYGWFKHLVHLDASEDSVAGGGANTPGTGPESTGGCPRCNVTLYTCTVLYCAMCHTVQ